MADDNWRTPTFRQSVVAKIDEAIRQSGMNTSRNSIEMENHVFHKAKNKEEYLGFVARLILHVREMNSKKGQPGMNGQGPQQGGPGMPDPINALQNLASQGTRQNMPMGMGGPQPGQMGGPQQGPASSLLQTLNRGPQGQQMMMAGMGGNMPMQNMNMNQNAGPMGGQMGGQMPTQMQMQLQAQQQGMGGGPMPGQMGGQMGQMGGQMAGQMNMGGMQGPMGGQMMAMQMGQPKPPGPGGQNPMMMNHPNMGPGGGFARQPNPNMFNASPLPQSVQSPAGVGGQMGVGPVPSPVMAPSPGGMGMMQGGPRSIPMAPSPGGSSLNTPAGQQMQSPMGGAPMTDEQAYREKVRQLSKYIEPLRKMIAKMGNDGMYGDKMSKMKKLLEILSNPHQRMPLDTLIKCEVVLEKIDFKRSEGSAPSSSAPNMPFKEPHVFSALLDAVSQNLNNPNINHTLHRTFGPTLDTLFGPEIKLVPSLKEKIEEPAPGEIPDVLQGEIARLDQKFKVSLDPNQQPGTKQIKLTCWLDDKNLPCVPPISLTVPEDYPKVSPNCHMAPEDYNATEFFSKVQDALQARMQKLPKHYSVSHLLDTWEMSVRQACSPNNACPISAMAMMLGL